MCHSFLSKKKYLFSIERAFSIENVDYFFFSGKREREGVTVLSLSLLFLYKFGHLESSSLANALFMQSNDLFYFPFIIIVNSMLFCCFVQK